MNPFFYSWIRQSDAPEFPMVGAAGAEFLLAGGRRVFDGISTSFQACFGHSFEPLREKLRQQLDAFPMASPKADFALKQSVSQQLVDAIGLGPGRIFYTVSGAEAVENALKIARQIRGRKLIGARYQSYHGASLGALSVTGDWRNAPHLTFDEGTLRIPGHDQDPDLAEVRRRLDGAGSEGVAAVILETISGTNGMAIPPRDWMRGIQDLCRERDILLILDEVLVGFGRCGSLFAFQEFGLEPDLVCLSKAITGGYIPFGAVWVSGPLAAHYDREVLACGLTNYGHPLGLAALEVVLERLRDPGFAATKREHEEHFARGIENLARHPRVRDTRCRGLMAAIFVHGQAPTWQQAFARDLHLFSKDDYTILAPPYVATPEQLDTALDCYASLLDADAGKENS